MQEDKDKEEWELLKTGIELELETALQAFQKENFTRDQKLGRIRGCCEFIIRDIDNSKWS